MVAQDEVAGQEWTGTEGFPVGLPRLLPWSGEVRDDASHLRRTRGHEALIKGSRFQVSGFESGSLSLLTSAATMDLNSKTVPLRARVKFSMHLAQPCSGDMRVHLRGADAGMAEQFLDDAQIRAVFQQMRGETVPQHVGRDVAFDARKFHPVLDPQPHCHRGKRLAAPVQKNCRW